MNNEELYIEDQKVDLGNALITLKFQSNFLGDITKIQTNYSYTIKVPKTANNTRIFNLSDMPSIAGTDNNFLRKYNNARYFRNGIQIFKGHAIMLRATDKAFELCLNWGDLLELKKIIEAGENLNEAFDQDESFAVKWDENSVSISTDNYFYRYLNGATANIQNCNVHPAVRLDLIFALIRDKYGLEFIFPNDRDWWNDILYDNVLLCITRRQTKQTVLSNPTECEVGISNNYLHDAMYYKYVRLSRMFTSMKELFTFTDMNNNPLYYVSINTMVRRIKFEINISVFPPTGGVFKGDVYFVISRVDGWNAHITSNDIHRVKMTKGTSGAIEVAELKRYQYTVNRPSSGNFYFYIASPDVEIGINYYHFNNYINMYVELTDDAIIPSEVEYPGWFPVFANLPAIKITDFIKSICWMFGLYVHHNNSDASNVVRFSPISILYNNKPQALNWSSKMINWQKHTPEQIEYRYGGMAQQNILKYSEDKTGSSVSQAIIEVEDSTLPTRTDLITLPYASSRWVLVDGFPVVSLFQYSVDGIGEDKKIEFEVIEPRVLHVNYRRVDGGLDKWLSFRELDFHVLKDTYYTEYQKLMQRPVVITERFNLTEFDLRDIDFTIPIYLEQYGRYYAIITIEFQNGISKVELMQL